MQIVDMLRNIYRMHDIDKPPKLTRMDRDTRLPKKKGKVKGQPRKILVKQKSKSSVRASSKKTTAGAARKSSAPPASSSAVSQVPAKGKTEG